MATFDNKKHIDEFMGNDGWLLGTGSRDAPDNPPAVRIVEFTNAWGKIAWGVSFRGDRNLHRYEEKTHYVRNPRVIWTRRGESVA